MKNLEQANRYDFRQSGFSTVWLRTNWDDIFIGNDPNDSHSTLRDGIEEEFPKRIIIDAGYAYIAGNQLDIYEGSERLGIDEDNLFRQSSLSGGWAEFAAKSHLKLRK